MRSISDPFEGAGPIPSHSVADLAYERIRGLVLSGELAPGTRLGQVELAGRLGISRTPVREALRRLGGEGLVEGHSNRGFRVADLGLSAVLRRLEVREILEPGIARLAAERRTESHLEQLQGSIERERAGARWGRGARRQSRLSRHSGARVWQRGDSADIRIAVAGRSGPAVALAAHRGVGLAVRGRRGALRDRRCGGGGTCRGRRTSDGRARSPGSTTLGAGAARDRFNKRPVVSANKGRTIVLRTYLATNPAQVVGLSSAGSCS